MVKGNFSILTPFAHLIHDTYVEYYKHPPPRLSLSFSLLSLYHSCCRLYSPSSPWHISLAYLLKQA